MTCITQCAVCVCGGGGVSEVGGGAPTRSLAWHRWRQGKRGTGGLQAFDIVGTVNNVDYAIAIINGAY